MEDMQIVILEDLRKYLSSHDIVVRAWEDVIPYLCVYNKSNDVICSIKVKGCEIEVGSSFIPRRSFLSVRLAIPSYREKILEMVVPLIENYVNYNKKEETISLRRLIQLCNKELCGLQDTIEVFVRDENHNTFGIEDVYYNNGAIYIDMAPNYGE